MSETYTQIIRELNGELSSDERKIFAERLKKDPDFAEEYRQMAKLWRETSQTVNPDEIDVERALKATLSRISSSSARGVLRRAFDLWQRVAAVLVIPILAFSIYQITQEPEKALAVFNSPAMIEVKAPYGSQTQITLPDQSKVWLNAGATLRYPQSFNSRERNVELNGEAYFKVQSNELSPFTVTTSSLKVKATGTAFNVNACVRDSIAWVALVEGKVQVAVPASNDTLVMDVGKKFAYNRKSTVTTYAADDMYKLCAWKDGVMVFRNDPLNAVFARLEKHFNVKFIVKDRPIGGYIYRATFEEESLSEIIRLLELSTPISFKYLPRDVGSDYTYSKQKIVVFFK